MHLDAEEKAIPEANNYHLKVISDELKKAESSISEGSVLLTASAVLPCIPDCMRWLAGRLSLRKPSKDLHRLQRCEPVVEVRHQPVHTSRLVREDQHLGTWGGCYTMTAESS